MTSSAADVEGEFRCEPVARFSLGRRGVAVVLGHGAPPRVVARAVAERLDALRSFATLEAHARALTAHGGSLDATLAWLEELARAGILSRKGRPSWDGTGDPAVVVETVGFVTRDRPRALSAAVQSFAANARAHGRRCVFVVADQSAPAARDESRRALRSIARERGASIVHVDAAARDAFSDELARASGVDRDLVAFALAGEGLGAAPTGANRNVVLLACAGSVLVTSDDDIRAELAAPRDADAAPRVAIDHEMNEFEFFADRASALAGVARAEVDLLAEHERYLGRGGVVATCSGVFGDAGMSSPLGLVLRWPSLARGPDDAERRYALARTSREALRSVRAPTIARGGPFFAGCVGLDDRALLPPFLPAGRNQDGVFAATLERCFERARIAHLPLAVLHDAEARGPYPTPGEAAAGTRLAELLRAMILFGSAARGAGTPEERMEMLGLELATIGRASTADFLDAVRPCWLRMLSGRAHRCEQLLATPLARTCAPWARDLEAVLDAVERAIADPEGVVPVDLRAGAPAAERLSATRHVMERFGELMRVWPALVKAARQCAMRLPTLAASA